MLQNIIDERIEENHVQIRQLEREILELEAQKEKAQTNTGVNKWLGYCFESSSGLTEEFAQFARDYKKHLLTILPQGAELVNFSRGHFDLSGFVKRGDRFVYFSISDVRGGGWEDEIMVRTAESEKDYTSGSNNWTNLEGFKDRVGQLLV